MSIARRLMRRLGLGREKYFVGLDLDNNAFYERPHPELDPTDWRKNKRSVEYAVARPLSEYGFDSVPPQWASWMRRTRKDPPTIEELIKDVQRQERLKENVMLLEQAHAEQKARRMEIEAPTSSSTSTSRPRNLPTPESNSNSTASVESRRSAETSSEQGASGLPSMHMSQEEALKATRIGTPSSDSQPTPPSPSRSTPAQTSMKSTPQPTNSEQGLPNQHLTQSQALKATRLGSSSSPSPPNPISLSTPSSENTETGMDTNKPDVAKKRRESEKKKIERLRKESADKHAAVGGNPDAGFQPESWKPPAPARR